MAYKIMMHDTGNKISITGKSKEMTDLEDLLSVNRIKFSKEIYTSNPPDGMLGYLTQEMVITIGPIAISGLLFILGEIRASRQLGAFRKDLEQIIRHLRPKKRCSKKRK